MSAKRKLYVIEPKLHVAEPPARYLAKPPLIVDCSLLAGIVFSESTRAAAEARIAGRTLFAPYLLQNEIANVAVTKQRKGEADAAETLAYVASMEIDYRRINIEESAVLALHYGLSAYDAAYLWLAADMKAPLATFDAKLGAAATTHLAGLD